MNENLPQCIPKKYVNVPCSDNFGNASLFECLQKLTYFLLYMLSEQGV